MFTSLWNFVKRHRRKLVFSGVVIGGLYYAGRYARRKLQELQEQEAAECLSHARRQHHFDSNQRTCNMTVLSMLPTLRAALLENIRTEDLTEELKNKPANKIAIWEELKILSFTRSVTAVYSVSMMIVLLRVQLNIIGGYMYLDTLSNQNSMFQMAENTVATPEVQGQYLSSVEYLLGEGLSQLITAVKREVTKTLQHISLKEQISLLRLQTLINHVRQEMERRQQHLSNGYTVESGAGAGDASRLCHFLMPPAPEELEDSPSSISTQPQTSHWNKREEICERLQAETRDIVESADFQAVLTTCLDTGFNRFLDKIADFYKPTQQANGTLFSPNEVCLPLAKVIPVMNGLVHTICADSPNPYVQELILKEHVKNFAANVYEAFSQESEQT